MSEPGLSVRQVTPQVLRLQFDRPPVNALDELTYQAATRVISEASQDPAVHVLILTGAGRRAFCAGSDHRTFADTEEAARVASASNEFFEAVTACGVPVVAALNGPAVGGGAMLAAVSDVVVAVSQAYLAIPELALGILGGASHLLMALPFPKVARMMLLGEHLTCAEALQFGFVAEAVDDVGALDAAALRHADVIARLDPAAVREARRLLRAERSRQALTGFRAEMAAIERLRAAAAPRVGDGR